MIIRVLIFIITCFFTSMALAGNGAVTLLLTDAESALKLPAKKVDVFRDESNELTLKQVLSPEVLPEFEPYGKKILNFKTSSSAWWVRFTLRNESEKKWYLLVDSMLGAEFKPHIFPVEDTSTSPELLSEKYVTPLADYRRRAWSLALPRDQTYQVYIKATNGDSTLSLPIEFLQSDAMLKKSNWAYLLFGAAYFAMIVLAIYQFLYAFILREYSYATLGLFMLAMMVAFHRSSPAFSSLSFVGSTTSYFSTLPISITLASFMAFSRQMLDLANIAPRCDRVFKGVIALALLMVLVVGAIPGGKVLPVSLGLIVLLLVFFTSAYLGRKGHNVARNFAWVFLIPLLAQVPNIVMMILQISDYKIIQDIAVVSSTLIFMFFMALMQAERVRNMREEMQKHKVLGSVSGKLSKYVSPQIYNMIFEGKHEVKLGTDSKELTVFFSDIVDFTHQSEQMKIDELATWLNGYLNEMAQIALDRKGTIDKFIGDAIMIFYGDPYTAGKKQDAINCVRMAVAMQKKARSLGINIRIGINSGPTIVGNFGAEDRLDYTVVGRSVNLAARLEKKADPGEILVSEATYQLIHSTIPCVAHGPLTVKGFAYPVETYEVLQNP